MKANIYLQKKRKHRKEGRVGRCGAKVGINRDMIEAGHRAKTIKLPFIGNWE